MALNWNVEKVENYKEIVDGEEMSVTDALIWATMTVGIGEITEANAEEFFKRLHLQEKVNGTWLVKGGKPEYITIDQVKRRIGLSTNAARFSRAEFNKRLLKNYWQ